MYLAAQLIPGASHMDVTLAALRAFGDRLCLADRREPVPERVDLFAKVFVVEFLPEFLANDAVVVDDEVVRDSVDFLLVPFAGSFFDDTVPVVQVFAERVVGVIPVGERAGIPSCLPHAFFPVGHQLEDPVFL